jgi:hypothetical protein
MAAYYSVGNEWFIKEEDLDGDTDQLIQSEVLWEMEKRGISKEDALASLLRVVNQLEEESHGQH